jgi:hypothetical protein
MPIRIVALAAIVVFVCVIGHLMRRIGELSTRVEQLERRQSVVTFQPAGARPTAVVPAIPHERTPDGWGRHEFNGQPYYIAPLASSQPGKP